MQRTVDDKTGDEGGGYVARGGETGTVDGAMSGSGEAQDQQG